MQKKYQIQESIPRS